MAEKRYNVLIVDDDEADRVFLKEVIRSHAHKLHVIDELEDGAQVVEYLSGKGKYADRQAHPWPEVLILDMRMPRMNGLEVLEWLKMQSFPRLKIAVMAESVPAIDRARALKLGVEHFFSKLMHPNELIPLVERLQDELESGEKGAACERSLAAGR